MRYKEKEKKTDKKQKKRFITIKSLLVWGLAFVILVGIMVAYFRVEQRISQYEESIDELSSEIKDLKKTNKSLENQMENVNSDEYIERIARERLGMVKKNEVVLKQSDEYIDDESDSQTNDKKASESTEKSNDKSKKKN